MTPTRFWQSTWGTNVECSDLPRRIGSPSLGLDADAIATILDLLCSGWSAVVACGEVDGSSMEPDIAGHLVREMLAEKKRRGVTTLRIEEEVGTRSSPGSPKPEGRIDVKVIYSFDEDEYFGIECKRLGGTRRRRLASKYVTEGVLRFVEGKYSPAHAWCAMAGFVIDGLVLEAVELVSDELHKRRSEVRLDGRWMPEPRFGSYDHLYRTTHRQSRPSSRINVLHLFLSLSPAAN
jgi:hypothetical protein